MGQAGMTYELHELCVLFPRITGAEFEALKDDIRANGLREPITLHNGMVLDGGNRYRACLETGVEPVFVEHEGDDLVSFVLSANLHRRHLSPGQHAAIVASVTNWAEVQGHGGDRRSDQVATLPLETLADRAKVSGASPRTQRMADKVAKADPELAREVAQGKTTLPIAVAQVEGKAKPDQVATLPLETEPSDTPALDELIDELQRENKILQAQVEAINSSDPAAKAVTYVRMYEDAVRKQSEEMDKTKLATDREAWTKKQLMRCGKAVGEEDPTRIAAAVEAMARAAKKVEA